VLAAVSPLLNWVRIGTNGWERREHRIGREAGIGNRRRVGNWSADSNGSWGNSGNGENARCAEGGEVGLICLSAGMSLSTVRSAAGSSLGRLWVTAEGHRRADNRCNRCNRCNDRDNSGNRNGKGCLGAHGDPEKAGCED